MMQYSSQGVRNAVRKGSNALVHHGGHNGSGGNTAGAQTSRSYMTNVFNAGHPPSGPTLQSIRPRDPAHKLFSASKNLLQRFFTHLTAPGLRAPSQFASQVPGVSGRSLHNAVRGSTIQANLSLPARHALRNNALQRQMNTFLPRAPGPVPPRFGGIAQVGLGTARNFCSTRPIFQQLAENVPIAGRALYEIDWDTEMRKEQARMHRAVRKESKKPAKTQEKIKPVQKRSNDNALHTASNATSVSAEEMEQYFPTSSVALVTTYLLIPLAPTPTSRLPLPLDPTLPSTSAGREPTLLPHLSQLGSIHESYGTHALRVSTLFARLDQANVWTRGGVHCSAYSQGQAHHWKPSGIEADEGVCTILRIEFVGWTKAEVRSVIGESGSGWCVLEEVFHEEELNEDTTSDIDSLSGSLSDYLSGSNTPFEMESGDGTDITRSFVLPTIDLSSSSSHTQGAGNALSSIPAEMIYDPWVDDSLSLVSPSSSYSDLSDLMIGSPFANEWSDGGYISDARAHIDSPYMYGSGVRELEPREGMFY